MRYFLTGVTGFLGNNLAREILARGDEVLALVRPGSDPTPLSGLPVEQVQGDLNCEDVLAEACQRVDAVIHAAGFVKIGWWGVQQARKTNVDGTRNVARAARLAGAPMVHVSTVNALALGTKDTPADEDTPIRYSTQCPYVVSKRAGDAVICEEIERGLHASIVYPGFMLGPWDWKPSSGQMLLQVHSQFTPMAPRGGASVCDVRDVAKGILSAIDEADAGERFIMAGENLSYLQLWQLISEVTGGTPPISRTGPVLPFIAGKAGDLWATLRGEEGVVNSAAAEMSGQLHYYCSDHARRRLGYDSRSPAVSIRDAWQWLEEHGYACNCDAPASRAA